MPLTSFVNVSARIGCSTKSCYCWKSAKLMEVVTLPATSENRTAFHRYIKTEQCLLQPCQRSARLCVCVCVCVYFGHGRRHQYDHAVTKPPAYFYTTNVNGDIRDATTQSKINAQSQGVDDYAMHYISVLCISCTVIYFWNSSCLRGLDTVLHFIIRC